VINRPDGNLQYAAAAHEAGKSQLITFREYRIGQTGDPVICLGHCYITGDCRRGMDRAVSHFLPTRALREAVAAKPFVDVVQRWATDVALGACVISDDAHSLYLDVENKKRVALFVKDTYMGLPWETLTRVNSTRPAPNLSALRVTPPKRVESPEIAKPKPKPKPKSNPKPVSTKASKPNVILIPTAENLETLCKEELLAYCEGMSIQGYTKRSLKGDVIGAILAAFEKTLAPAPAPAHVQKEVVYLESDDESVEKLPSMTRRTEKCRSTTGSDDAEVDVLAAQVKATMAAKEKKKQKSVEQKKKRLKDLLKQLEEEDEGKISSYNNNLPNVVL
jgi:hypothetical protein